MTPIRFRGSRLFCFACIVAFLLSVHPTPTRAQILQLGELNSDQIRELDRAKTVVVIPGGILEEHGPYLPAYTDGYANAYFTQELARAIVSRPGWNAVLFPQVPVGSGGANEIGAKYIFPGSYTVRQSTLRAVYMDLADQFGNQGFRWIFLVHDHGDPAHNRMLDQASDYFHDTYGGNMVHLLGLNPLMICCDTSARVLTAGQRAEDGFTVHAGAEETSQILFLRPELVSQHLSEAPSWTGKNFDDLYTMAAKPDWPGYFGAPRYASAALGAQSMRDRATKINETALQILDGLDWRKIPRFADDLDPRDAKGEAANLEHEKAAERKQSAWLRAHKIE